MNRIPGLYLRFYGNTNRNGIVIRQSCKVSSLPLPPAVSLAAFVVFLSAVADLFLKPRDDDDVRVTSLEMASLPPKSTRHSLTKPPISNNNRRNAGYGPGRGRRWIWLSSASHCSHRDPL